MHGQPTVVNNVETLCNVPFIAAHGAAAYRGAEPRARPRARKLVCFNERFARPGIYEVSVRDDDARDLRGPRRRTASTAARSRRCRSAVRSAGILPGWKLDTPFDFDDARRGGLHGRPRRHPRLRRSHRHARRRQAPARLRRRRELRQVLPLPDRPPARARDVRAASDRVDRDRLEALLETLEFGSLCAHGGGMPAPIRSLLDALPRRAGG